MSSASISAGERERDEQIAAGIGRVAHADMAEGVEHAFVRQHAVGERDLVADVGKIIWHGRFLISVA